MTGRNVPLANFLLTNQVPYPSSAVLDYDGDPGNTTTLNHTLWMAGIIPNATIAEVMDLGGDLICAEYI
jgi:tyrosinase